MSSLKRRFEAFKAKANDWLYDHQVAKNGLDYLGGFLLSTLSALCFAFGFNCFIDLQGVSEAVAVGKFVSGGMSGISQNVVLFLELCGLKLSDEHMIISLLYFILNVPMIVLAFVGIGKRYAIFTLINVVETSLLIRLLAAGNVSVINDMAIYVNSNGGLLARVIFGGVTTGLSTALAFKGDFSTGGVDIISYYISLKKGTLVGKYNGIINGTTFILFTLFSCLRDGQIADHCATILFSIVYLFVSILVIDSINVRNKKLKVEVVTDNQELGQWLISYIGHGATMFRGEGVYSGKEKFVFTIIVSSPQLNSIISAIKKEDPNAFVNVMTLLKVHGRFFDKPIR